MDARELFAAGKTGDRVRLSVDDADGGGVVLAGGTSEVTLSAGHAALFKALLSAHGPIDKAQIKARVWKTQAISSATVQNAITGLRRALSPLFDDPVAATGRPARYALNLGLPSNVSWIKPAAPPRWPARLIVCASQSLCCTIAAGLALQSIEGTVGAGIVLATGRTAGEVFHAATAMAEKRRFSGLEQARYFIDTETLGVMPGHSISRHGFVRKSWIDRIRAAGYRIGEDRVAFFRGSIEDEPSHFERFFHVLKATPLALHLVSVSPQGGLIGHSAGSNESLDDLMSDCRVTTMSEADRRYIDARLPSRAMLSIGLLNLLRADELLVPVYHEAKAAILRVLFSADPDPAIPATLLKLHRRATVITTRTMAGELIDRDDVVEISSQRDAAAKLGVYGV